MWASSKLEGLPTLSRHNWGNGSERNESGGEEWSVHIVQMRRFRNRRVMSDAFKPTFLAAFIHLKDEHQSASLTASICRFFDSSRLGILGLWVNGDHHMARAAFTEEYESDLTCSIDLVKFYSCSLIWHVVSPLPGRSNLKVDSLGVIRGWMLGGPPEVDNGEGWKGMHSCRRRNWQNFIGLCRLCIQDF